MGSFNTQPPEGGWVEHHINLIQSVVVSTHSRPKAAGFALSHPNGTTFVSTHSRPKAADLTGNDSFYRRKVSTHSRPKAAGTAARRPNGTTESFNTQPPEGGWVRLGRFAHRTLGFNTQPPEGGWTSGLGMGDAAAWFQHTAARRRLVPRHDDPEICYAVSTHSRPKAAGIPRYNPEDLLVVSTHSRPKAAGSCSRPAQRYATGFNTQPPEGGWRIPI